MYEPRAGSKGELIIERPIEEVFMTRFVTTVKSMGRTFDITVELTGHDRPTRLAFVNRDVLG